MFCLIVIVNAIVFQASLLCALINNDSEMVDILLKNDPFDEAVCQCVFVFASGFYYRVSGFQLRKCWLRNVVSDSCDKPELMELDTGDRSQFIASLIRDGAGSAAVSGPITWLILVDIGWYWSFQTSLKVENQHWSNPYLIYCRHYDVQSTKEMRRCWNCSCLKGQYLDRWTHLLLFVPPSSYSPIPCPIPLLRFSFLSFIPFPSLPQFIFH